MADSVTPIDSGQGKRLLLGVIEHRDVERLAALAWEHDLRIEIGNQAGAAIFICPASTHPIGERISPDDKGDSDGQT